MLSNLLNEMKENLKDFRDHPQRDWLNTFIIEKEGYYYLNSIQDKNRLNDDEMIVVSEILREIGYTRFNNTIRFNISKFYKKFKEFNK